MLLEWKADSESTRVEDGIDTFVFRDGVIRVQTVRYTPIEKSGSVAEGPPRPPLAPRR
jgi:hypothetical protein